MLLLYTPYIYIYFFPLRVAVVVVDVAVAVVVVAAVAVDSSLIAQIRSMITAPSWLAPLVASGVSSSLEIV